MAELLKTASIGQQALIAVSFFLIYLVGLAFYRLVLSPIAKFPGPKLAALTRYYEFYYDMIKPGQYVWEIQRMHEKYGPIVRISPYELHVNEPDFHEKLYRQDGKWDKYDFAYGYEGRNGAGATTIGHDLHKLRRVAMNPFFSKQKVVSLEPVVQTQVDKLAKRFEEFAANGKVASIGVAYGALAMDIITEYAMEKSYGNLDYEDFNENLSDVVRGFGPFWRTSKHFQYLPLVFKYVPKRILRKMNPQLSHWRKFQVGCMEQLQRVIDAGEQGVIHEKTHKTIFHELYHSKVLPKSEKDPVRLRDEAQTIIVAGTDTVGHTLRVITFHLTQNRHMLEKLRAELKTVEPGTDGNWKVKQLEHLPYLNAVLMEGLRLAFGVVTRLARLSPEVIEFEDWKIPPRTPVGMTSVLLFLNENLYPEPHRYDPERWTDPAERRRLEKSFQPFSKGTRNCVGQNLAWSELYLGAATILSRFDFTLVDSPVDVIQFDSDQFVAGNKSKSGLKARIQRVTESPSANGKVG